MSAQILSENSGHYRERCRRAGTARKAGADENRASVCHAHETFKFPEGDELCLIVAPSVADIG